MQYLSKGWGSSFWKLWIKYPTLKWTCRSKYQQCNNNLTITLSCHTHCLKSVRIRSCCERIFPHLAWIRRDTKFTNTFHAVTVFIQNWSHQCFNLPYLMWQMSISSRFFGFGNWNWWFYVESVLTVEKCSMNQGLNDEI